MTEQQIAQEQTILAGAKIIDARKNAAWKGIHSRFSWRFNTATRVLLTGPKASLLSRLTGRNYY